MKKIICTLFFIPQILVLSAQETKKDKNNLKNNFIVNFINPGVEYELVLSNKTLVSFGTGIGYSGSYTELTAIPANGFVYEISPFLDIQYKFIYNRKKRLLKGKSLTYNSGNFVSFRSITRGKSIESNYLRTDKIDFAIGPTWGFQRSYNKSRLLIDIGPQYYFDTNGNKGFFPFMVQINFGLNL